MPYARAEMYNRREDVQRGKGAVCVRGEKHRRLPRQQRERAPPCHSAFSQHPRADLRLWGSRGAEVRGSQQGVR